MKYGKTKHGSIWHMLPDDKKAMCWPKMTIEVTKEKSELTDDDAVCRICDGHLRAKGKGAASKTRPNPKVHYRPRNKFEDS